LDGGEPARLWGAIRLPQGRSVSLYAKAADKCIGSVASPWFLIAPFSAHPDLPRERVAKSRIVPSLRQPMRWTPEKVKNIFGGGFFGSLYAGIPEQARWAEIEFGCLSHALYWRAGRNSRL
jgi:hypothetical protein